MSNPNQTTMTATERVVTGICGFISAMPGQTHRHPEEVLEEYGEAITSILEETFNTQGKERL